MGEVPKDQRPEDPIETHSRIGINLMGKRYVMEVNTRAYQVKPEDADVVEITRPSGPELPDPQ